MVSHRPFLFRALVAFLLAFRSWAVELPVARLDTLFPPGGQAGAEVAVAITGADLDDAKELRFSHPGITGVAKDKGFVVKIAPDVPPGIYDVRVSGLLGLSNPRAFVVSDLPQTLNAGTHHTPESALELASDSTIAGAATAAAPDYFKLTVKKGQRLLVECEAGEIDSRMMPVLAIIDPAGHELAISRRGGLLDFTAAADGIYLLKVNDLTFAGGAEYFYRLTVSTRPYIDFVFPPCAKPGAKTSFSLYGRNLPGGTPANVRGQDGQPLEKLAIEIDVPATADKRGDGLWNPAALAVDGFSYRLKTPHASNAVFIGFSDQSIVTGQEPGNPPGPVVKITPPCEVVGQFRSGGAPASYTFEAKNGEVWWFEIISQRVGLPTNPLILIQRDAGTALEGYAAEKNTGGVRFNTTCNDPALRIKAEADGTYHVKVRDLFGSGRSDANNAYRLIVRKESPDFRLIAVAEPPPEKKDDRSAAPYSTLLRGDGTVAIKVLAIRRDGFAGAIELRAEDLPPGVTCLPTEILPGADSGVVLLTCGDKPGRWAGAIRIVGHAKIGETEFTREARGGVVRWAVADANVEAVHARLTREIELAVSAAESAPVSVAAAEDKCWEIPAGGRIEIPLKIARRGEFKEALKLKAVGAPGIESVKEIEVAANAATGTAIIDLATAKIPANEYTIYFEGQSKGKFRGKDVTTTIYSAPIRLAVEPPAPK